MAAILVIISFVSSKTLVDINGREFEHNGKDKSFTYQELLSDTGKKSFRESLEVKSYNDEDIVNRISVRETAIEKGSFDRTDDISVQKTNNIVINDVVILNEDNIAGYLVYYIMLVSGFYITFFGLRVFRLLMMILGFYLCYYTLLVVLTELDIYQNNNTIHEIYLLVISLLSAVTISFFAFYFESLNFAIFGFSIGTIISLFYIQFFVDNSIEQNINVFLTIYIFSVIIPTIIGYFLFDNALIVGSALVGSVVMCVNFGLITEDFKSFEDRKKVPLHYFVKFWHYCCFVVLLFLGGILIQFLLRKRIVNQFKRQKLRDGRNLTTLE